MHRALSKFQHGYESCNWWLKVVQFLQEKADRSNLLGFRVIKNVKLRQGFVLGLGPKYLGHCRLSCETTCLDQTHSCVPGRYDATK